MGFVKAKIPTSSRKPMQADCETLKVNLDDPDAAVRRHSARAIRQCPGAVRVLATRLRSEQDMSVRKAILDTMGEINDPDVANQLVEYLRSDDAALRNEAIEIFKRLATDVVPTLNHLLSDPDPDVRIFAVNILESRCEPDVERMLIGVIVQDKDVNVCATAMDLLCEVGTEAALDPILGLKARFASEAYLQFATDLALKRIREN